MSLFEIPVSTLDGAPTTLAEHRGNVLLVVNVASKCGFTPQYDGLQRLHDRLSGAGLAVLGFPCNQFLFQEPGGPQEIREFCTSTYAVTFQLFGKVKVRGRGRHPLYAELSRTRDRKGKAGAVRWNFEKFLVGRDGRPLMRYRSRVAPDDPAMLANIDEALARHDG